MSEAGRDAHPRHHGQAAGGDVHRARIGLSATGSRAVRRADLHPGQGAPRLPRRDRQGVVLGARTPARGAPGRPRRLRAGHAVHHRRARRGPAGQDPPAPAARRPVHRPGRPARAQGRLRAARPVPADRRLRRARAEHRHLRRAAAGRAAAVDADARRVPAARAGPPLRPRPGGGRLRTVPGPGRRVGVQDRLDAGESPRTRTADPARRRRLHPHHSRRPIRPHPKRIRPAQQHGTRRRPAHPHPRRHDPVRRHHHTGGAA